MPHHDQPALRTSPAASLKNSLHRRNHKERSQLSSRAKLGLLEKHADYVKRARDYHAKKDAIERLQRKAADRNKDEFYFGMTRQKTKRGVHVHDRGNRPLPTDIVKVLKTQDENYVRTMKLANLKKIDGLKRQLTTLADLVNSEEGLDDEELVVLRQAHILPSKKNKTPNHIVFVENQAEALQYAKKRKRPSASPPKESTSVEPEEEEEEEEVDLGWIKPKKTKSKKKVSLQSDNEEPEPRGPSASRSRLLKELAARLQRDVHLGYAQRELEMQRLLMGKGARSKISGVEKVEGDESEEDEDELDARKGKPKKSKPIDESLYKPRVYKWKLQRK